MDVEPLPASACSARCSSALLQRRVPAQQVQQRTHVQRAAQKTSTARDTLPETNSKAYAPLPGHIAIANSTKTELDGTNGTTGEAKSPTLLKATIAAPQSP